MAETVGKTVEGWRLHHRHFSAHLLQGFGPTGKLGRIAFAVNQHIEQAELHLAHDKHAALEVFGGYHFVEQLARQRAAAFFVRRHFGQHLVFPHEVFHKLAGQLHRVPFYAVDAGYAQFVDAGQQVVQAVAGFVEQGDDFVVREARFFAVYRRGEVAHQIGHRCLDTAGFIFGEEAASAAVVVHPRPAALAFAGV